MVLIDMDRLRKELMAKGDIPIHEVFNTIWEQPIVNVSQQKVGKWIDAGFDYECTNCKAEINAEIYYMSESEIKYCPYCGIKLIQTTKMCEEVEE